MVAGSILSLLLLTPIVNIIALSSVWLSVFHTIITSSCDISLQISCKNTTIFQTSSKPIASTSVVPPSYFPPSKPIDIFLLFRQLAWSYTQFVNFLFPDSQMRILIKHPFALLLSSLPIFTSTTLSTSFISFLFVCCTCPIVDFQHFALHYIPSNTTSFCGISLKFVYSCI